MPGVVTCVLLLSAFADIFCVGAPLLHRRHPSSLNSWLFVYSAFPLRLTSTPA